MSNTKVLTILCVPLSSSGHINATLALCGILKQRGHRIVLATERSWQGKFTSKGYEEEVYDEMPLPEDGKPPKPNEFFANIIKEIGHYFRKAPVEQFPMYKLDMEIFVKAVKYSNERIKAIVQKVEPDIILQDHYLCYPALATLKIPWVLLCSANPLFLLEDGNYPPAHSGLPTTDSTGWLDFINKRREVSEEVWTGFNEWVVQNGCPPLQNCKYQYKSTNLNVYVYPKWLDYDHCKSLGDEWHRIDCIAAYGSDALGNGQKDEFIIPNKISDLPGKLIYFSLGSMGSGEVKLMKDLVAALSKSPHRFIVSKGPFHDQYELAPNMWGEGYLPQLSILPKVDLVITHGGNNTLTECLYFAKPLIVMPLFWDQHDNAQRIVERKLGARFNLYSQDFDNILPLIEHVLNDDTIKRNVEQVSTQLRESQSIVTAADRIEKVAQEPKFPIIVP